ncbi:MAG: hypothetical protein CMP47_10585 [Rickettsiales bacterium]|nr:hypothetical protein [Rickettsiales bacterium]
MPLLSSFGQLGRTSAHRPAATVSLDVAAVTESQGLGVDHEPPPKDVDDAQEWLPSSDLQLTEVCSQNPWRLALYQKDGETHIRDYLRNWAEESA